MDKQKSSPAARLKKEVKRFARRIRKWFGMERTAAMKEGARLLQSEIDKLVPWNFEESCNRLRQGHLGEIVPKPTVTVIIPVYNKVEYTVRCLISIGSCREATPFEILLVDDHSTDLSESLLSQCPGLRYLRNEKNSGFIESCNRGASESRGIYLHFLNNDTIVLPGWLDRLVETFERYPNAGLVGSKLLYPNGLLQEAGGIIYSDASGNNRGKGQDPREPRYNYLRRTDYCSGASLLVPRELFISSGMFDLRFRPAYYEDTDLAFTIRKLGFDVLYQPLSRVVHLEGISSGTDLHQGVKSHQLVNQHSFKAKWATVLQAHSPSGVDIDKGDNRPSALIFDLTTPTPDRDSGSADMYNLLLLLAAEGYQVTYVPLNLKHEGRYTDELQAVGVQCIYSPYFRNWKHALEHFVPRADLVILNRLDVADLLLDRIRARNPNAKVVFNTVDLHFLRESREAELVGSPSLARRAESTKGREIACIQKSDATIVISREEERVVRQLVSSAMVTRIPLIRDPQVNQANFATRSGFVFIGNFKHPPNVDAVEYLLKDVWPGIHARLPQATLHIIGQAFPDRFRLIAGPGVTIEGHLPELTTLLSTVRLSLAPLRYGAGLKGKIATSLCHGVPCVTTSVGAEGSGMVEGKDVLIADDTTAFVNAAVLAHESAELWDTLSSNGISFVQREFSMEANRARLAKMLAELATPTART